MKQQQNKQFSLRKNFSLMLVGNVLYSLSQWGILIILAKLGTSKMVGEFALGLTVTAPIIFLTDLQLRSVLATDAKCEHKFADYFRLKIVMSILALVLLVIVIVVSDYETGTALVVLIIGFSKIVESFCELNYGLFQKEDKISFISRSLISRGIFSIIAVGVVMWITESLLAAVIGLVISWAVILLVVDLPSAGTLETHKSLTSVAAMKTIFIKSLPLGFVTMLLSLNINLPRYILEQYEGTEALGIFSAISYILISGNILIGALGQATNSRLAVYYSNQQYKDFVKLIRFLVASGVALGFVGFFAAVLIGKPLLAIFYSEEYANHQNLFVVLMLAGVFLYTSSFLGVALTSMRKFKIQPLLAGAWVVVTLAASLAFIPSYGLNGAAYAILTSAIFQFVTLAVVIASAILKMKRTNLTSLKSVQKQSGG